MSAPQFTALIDVPAQPAAPQQRLRRAFRTPREWLVARSPGDVKPVLDAAEAHALGGRWCVGYVRYEAAAAFDPALVTHGAQGPLACFAVFDSVEDWPADGGDAHAFDPWQQTLGDEQFARDVERIRDWIAAGDVYQVNHTTRLRSRLRGDALAAFRALHRGQPRGYGVYLAHEGAQVLSVSPELFFDWRDGFVTTQPMKGTAARGGTPAEDEAAAATLKASEKERAENLMIVDLLRNDLSRVATLGSVRVPALFDLQALPTVWQMTSTVTATTHPGTTLAQLFGALFPCGSVTGAPKVRAMQLIRALEPTPRGVYCGAVGVLQPGGTATFNVAIRTVELTREPGDAWQAACGVGSAITADSQVAAEADEWRHKQRFLERAAVPFELLESLRLQDGQVWLLDEHLERLRRGAAHFGHALNETHVLTTLAELATAHPRGAHKLRLLVDAFGAVRGEAAPLQPGAVPLRTRLARTPIDARSEFLRHKTTRREAYAAFAPPAGCFDTLLWNTEGELTEFVNGNLALCLRGRWLTPAAAAGLLPGTYRARLLAQGVLQEARLTRDDLRQAEAGAFFNSVRGWLPLDLGALRA
jgi:para-aminobenzoate synthetase/4-amino-4-deoxychorismate lyase